MFLFVFVIPYIEWLTHKNWLILPFICLFNSAPQCNYSTSTQTKCKFTLKVSVKFTKKCKLFWIVFFCGPDIFFCRFFFVCFCVRIWITFWSYKRSQHEAISKTISKTFLLLCLIFESEIFVFVLQILLCMSMTIFFFIFIESISAISSFHQQLRYCLILHDNVILKIHNNNYSLVKPKFFQPMVRSSIFQNLLNLTSPQLEYLFLFRYFDS